MSTREIIMEVGKGNRIRNRERNLHRFKDRVIPKKARTEISNDHIRAGHAETRITIIHEAAHRVKADPVVVEEDNFRNINYNK